MISIFTNFDLSTFNLTVQSQFKIESCRVEIGPGEVSVHEANVLGVRGRSLDSRVSLQFSTSAVMDDQPAEWLLDDLESFLSGLSFWNPEVGFRCADYTQGEQVIDLKQAAYSKPSL